MSKNLHKKKILIVANVAKEHILKFHVPTIMKLKDDGWEVHVAASGDDEIPYCDFQYKTSWKRSPFTIKTFIGIYELKKIIYQGNYSIVYCHTPVGGLIARLASKKFRKKGLKVIYMIHGLHFFKGAPIINWLLYFPIEKYLSRFTDCIFTINREDYINVKKFFSKKISVYLVPGVGVNFSRFQIKNRVATRNEYRKKLGIDEDTLVLIYVAELIKNKNQSMLLKMLKEVKKEISNTVLLLVGPDYSNGHLKEIVYKLNIENDVKFLGWRNDIGELMITSDICTASSIREGFGLNLVEAMYCGLPVIATKNRGHVMLIQDQKNGFLVKIGDYKKMAKRVIEIHTNDELKIKLSNIDVKKYDAQEVASELCDLIKKFH